MKSPVGKLIISSWLAIFLAGCEPGSSGKLSAPSVSDTLKVPPTDTLAFAATAKGVQIYDCRANKENADQYEWVLKAPEADLFDARGKKIGHHYGGPSWASSDGSKVMGELKGSEPSSETNAIPWLLLSAKAHEGRGIFSRVNSIQRLETRGGKAPSGGCDQSAMGKQLQVPYTAVYYFYDRSHED
jgi:hypothetical protein